MDKHKAKGISSLAKRIKSTAKRTATIADAIVFLTAFILGRTHLVFGAYPFAIAFVSCLPHHVFIALAGAVAGSLTLGKSGIIFAMISLIVIFLRVIISGAERSEGDLFAENLTLRMSSGVIGGFVGAVYELLLRGLTKEAVLFSVSMILGVGILSLLFGALFLYPTSLRAFLFHGCGILHRESTPARKKAQLLFQVSLISYLLSLTYGMRSYTLFGISFAYLFLFMVTLFTARRFGAMRAAAVGFLGAIPLSPSFAVSFLLAGLAAGLLFPYGTMFGEGAAVGAVGLWSAYAEGLSGFLSTFPEAAVGALLFLPLVGRLDREQSPKEDAPPGRAAEMVASMALSIKNREEGSSSYVLDALTALPPLIGTLSKESGMPTAEDYNALVTECAAMRCKLCEHVGECDKSKTPFYLSLPGLVRTLCRHRIPETGQVGGCPSDDESKMQFLSALTSGAARLEEAGYKKQKNDGTPEIITLITSLMREARERQTEDTRQNDELTEKLSEIFRASGFPEGAVRVLGTRSPRLLLAAEDPDGTRITDPNLQKEIENTLSVSLCSPTYYRKDSYVLMDVGCEKRFRLSSASAALPHSEDGISGDVSATFEGRDGAFYAVLADGVGTGERANRGANFCVDFLKNTVDTGADRRTALYLLNEVIKRQGEECAGTVDLFALDLIRGDAEFYKVGAVTSFIKRDTSLFRISARSAPLGLTEGLSAERIRTEVRHGDLVILLSDGICQDPDGSPWLLELLSKKERRDLGAYAEDILRAAIKNEGKRDDMTVTVLRVEAAAS